MDPLAALRSADPLPADPLVGSLIAERLEILSLIGAGGMSTVYRAKHLLLDRVVAVKVMQVGKVDDNAVRRFQQEAKAATALNHPNIAAVREFGTAESGDPYLVMDYIDGTSLSDVIKQNGAIGIERTKEIMTQVCAGLQHAHALGVVHRDLKPANVMLFKDAAGNETAKIVDFGIAKILQSDGQTELTKAGEVFGTPLYMSPEQGLGKTVDARSDIYSLGCMMYECLSGKPPFSAETALETLLQHTTETAAPLKNAGALAQVAKRCLEKKPEDRYASAEELRQALIDPTKNRPRRKITASKVAFGITCFVTLFVIAVAGLVQPYLHRMNHPPQWKQLQNAALASQNLGIGNYDRAKHQYLQAAAEIEKEQASDADKEQLYKKIGQFGTMSEDLDLASKYLLKALEMNQKHAEDGETGSIHDGLGEVYKQQNKFELAVQHGELGVSIKKKYWNGSQFLLFAQLHLGQEYRKARHFAEAERTDREALALAEKVYPAGDDANLADAHEQLANILWDQRKNAPETIEHFRKGLEISILTRGAKNPKTEKLHASLIRFLQTHGQFTEAEKVPPLQ